MLLDQFSRIFREEHRCLRDILLSLQCAFKDRNQVRISSLIADFVISAGPHFRYEEEALHPALSEIYGENLSEKLLGEHDLVIRAVRGLAELGGKRPLADEHIAEASRLTWSILNHIIECDGLALMVERLGEETLRSILDARDRCRRESLDLLQWGSMMRKRPASI